MDAVPGRQNDVPGDHGRRSSVVMAVLAKEQLAAGAVGIHLGVGDGVSAGSVGRSFGLGPGLCGAGLPRGSVARLDTTLGLGLLGGLRFLFPGARLRRRDRLRRRPPLGGLVRIGRQRLSAGLGADNLVLFGATHRRRSFRVQVCGVSLTTISNAVAAESEGTVSVAIVFGATVLALDPPMALRELSL